MAEKSKSLLIIFYRNPVEGKVKTRLAASLGPEKALGIYQKLSLHTRSIAEKVPSDKIVFYSDSIDLMDVWPNATFLKAMQEGDDLGERMKHAFKAGFETVYDSICIIGTDCYELSTEVIRDAFKALETADAVIGPARDGGYYLLGMNRFYGGLFENKHWSTESVFAETVRDFESMGLRYVTLKVLRDVDTENDLPDSLRL